MDATRIPEYPAIKVLCLHGIGTNCDILAGQLAFMRGQLQENYEFEFVEGLHPWPPAPGIEDSLGPQPACFSYTDGTALSFIEAVHSLAEYVQEHGPFDIVIGFSLGASIVSTLLLGSIEEPETKPLGIRSCVFISAMPPLQWRLLSEGSMQFVSGDDAEARISVPTVHAWDENDPDYPGQAELLVTLCNTENRRDVRHSSGHRVPNTKSDVYLLCSAIDSMAAELRRAG